MPLDEVHPGKLTPVVQGFVLAGRMFICQVVVAGFRRV